MSQENVELTRDVLDAFTRRDLDAYLALTEPKVEFTPYEVAVQSGSPYLGHDGIRRWWEETFSVLPDLRPEVYEVRDSGEMTFVRGRLRGQGVTSGASFERALYIAAQWREGKLVSWHSFETEADALEAAGLSE
jgi:ketosteroid isomerase-like protein